LTVASILPDGSKLSYKLPEGFTFTNSTITKNWKLTGKPTSAGDYAVVIKSSGDVSGKSITDTINIRVVNATDIHSACQNDWIAVSRRIDGQLHIKFNLPRQENVTVSLYDMGGKRIYHDKVAIEPNMSLCISGFTALQKGIYLLKVDSDEGMFSTKLTK
jgi:hypothetical protein